MPRHSLVIPPPDRRFGPTLMYPSASRVLDGMAGVITLLLGRRPTAAPTSPPCNLTASLSLGVLIVIGDICEACESKARLGSLEVETHPPSLGQQAVLGDAEEVDPRPRVRELLRKVAMLKEVGLETGVSDVSGLVHKQVAPS